MVRLIVAAAAIALTVGASGSPEQSGSQWGAARWATQERPPCQPADDPSYGTTLPGRWLEQVFVEIGAPGGHPVAGEQVGDTGTALSINIAAYEDGPTLYATMLAKPFPENEDWEPLEREIGRHGDYTLYLTEGRPWESYTARSEEWQLALIAYPGRGNDEVTWPNGTLEWMQDAIYIARESPPDCS